MILKLIYPIKNIFTKKTIKQKSSFFINMSIIKLNKVPYYVNNDEFLEIKYVEYNNLLIRNDIGRFERIISLISEIGESLNIKNVCVNNPTHGGFIPIHCSKKMENVFLLNVKQIHEDNIQKNIEEFTNKNAYRYATKIGNNIKNIAFESNTIYNIPITTFEKRKLLIYSENSTQIEFDFIKEFTPILITSHDQQIVDCNLYSTIYNLTNSPLHIYIPEYLHESFIKEFHYFIKKSASKNVIELDYDNLINLCIMVKNGGPQFESMLKDNISLIDRWTILETGSTDETIEIINKVLVGKKKGTLFQEPFINFRESRNRCLDLAGESCKYLLMLDDTYVIEGDLRNFLNKVRGEQFSNSFSLIIQSDDVKYGSNRITLSNSGLRYIHTIHEVITDKDNINVLIPEEEVSIMDRRFDYMEKRTMERKKLDLQLLFEELEENPTDPRTYYYLGQTYNLIDEHEKAFFYFLKRADFTNAGFIQERVDAVFEAARIANFKLNKPWEECLELYEKCFKIDETRPEAMYFIGIHHYLENNILKAYEYFKKGFIIGFPEKAQYSLKPTLSFHFLPNFLSKICYQVEDYFLGEKACELFLLHNKPNNQIPNTDPNAYNEVASWHQIYKKLNIYQGSKIPKIPNKPIICFLADGGFEPWSGKNIYTTGVGGSETFVIEIARNIKKYSGFDVYVFCNCLEEEEFEGVLYKPLIEYYTFINENYIHSCIISRYSEYLPVTYKSWAENVYLLLHDLTPSGIVLPIDKKLKKILCLTEWHVEHFTSLFPSLKEYTCVFNHGIDIEFFLNKQKNQSEFNKANGNISLSVSELFEAKIDNRFIYSSFPNRGLLPLLQMWPKIYEQLPNASLHIYSDVNGKWANSVVPEHMAEIKRLIDLYQKRENKLGIVYHGWVNKSDLAKAWRSADIWFYPCIFQETFCLTALEAALTKTLVITNDLAALKNTVGDRGVIIKGDPMTSEWKQEALEKIFRYTDKKNNHFKKLLVERNYKWASQLSWESQAKKFLDSYILPNYLEYKGIYTWINQQPSGSKEAYFEILAQINKNQFTMKTNKILEIGTYNGISLINLVKSIPGSIGLGIDAWEVDLNDTLLKNMDHLEIQKTFYKNIEKEGLTKQISGIKGNPTPIMMEMIKNKEGFDFISINNRNTYLDNYSDLLLSCELLNKDGFIAINIFMYNNNKTNEIHAKYIENINYFIKNNLSKIEVIEKTNIIFIKKL